MNSTFLGVMSKTENSVLAKQVFEALYIVIRRRTLDSFAIQILKNTLEKLVTAFDFLYLVTIHDDFFSEDEIQVSFDYDFDAIDPTRFGEAIEALIRVIYLELTETTGDDVGLFFITEVKQHLGDSIVDEVHFEHIQTELHQQYQTKRHRPYQQPLQNKEPMEPQYTWDTVSTWKYDNNVCLLYDKQGRLLDRLQLDLIIEEYVERVTESHQQDHLVSPKTTMMKVSEKEQELLEMIQRHDTDVVSVVTLLHISRQKLDTMIQKLLQLEMLQYLSDNEVQLTEKGIRYLSDVHKNR